MGDDIVTRLRAHLVRREMTLRTHYDGCIDSHPICALAWSLDEIERLRAAGDALAATWPEEDRCGCNNKDCRAVVAAYDAWEEARRGI